MLLQLIGPIGIFLFLVGFLFVRYGEHWAQLLSNFTWSSHLLTWNSLWYRSGTKLYGRATFLKHAFQRRIGKDRLLRFQTGLSFLPITVGFGLVAAGILWWPGLEVTTVRSTNLREAWGVLASLISVAFIVIIFLLQYVENEYHNTTITKQFISQTYIIPVVYLSLFVLVFLGYVLTFQTPTGESLGEQWSSLVLLSVFVIPLSIGFVYYRITKRIFGQPLTSSLITQLEARMKRHLDGRTHRAIAQGMLEENELEGHEEGIRTNRHSETIESPTLERNEKVQIIPLADRQTGLSVTRNKQSPQIRYHSLLKERNHKRYLADIDMKQLETQLEPLYLYEDHFVIGLDSDTDKRNPAVAIVEAYPTSLDQIEDIAYELPNLDECVRTSRFNPWTHPIEDVMGDFRGLVTESVEDGEISTVEKLLETNTDLTRQVINRLDALRETDSEIPIRTDQIGAQAAKQLATTYAHLYLKFSTTNYVEITEEVFNKLFRMCKLALNTGHDTVVKELLVGFEDSYGRYRQQSHAQTLPKTSNDLVTLLRESQPTFRRRKAVRSNAPTDQLTSGVWQDIAQLNLKLLLRVLDAEADPKMFYKHWNQLYDRYSRVDDTDMSQPGDILPLLWFVSIGDLYQAYSQSKVSEAYFKRAMNQTVLSTSISIEEACRLLQLARKYDESRYTSLNLSTIRSEAGMESTLKLQETVVAEPFVVSFITIVSSVLGEKIEANNTEWVASLKPEELESISKVLEIVQFDIEIGSKQIATQTLKDIVETERSEQSQPGSPAVDDTNPSAGD